MEDNVLFEQKEMCSLIKLWVLTDEDDDIGFRMENTVTKKAMYAYLTENEARALAKAILSKLESDDTREE